MAQTYTRLLYHFVFSTKNRVPQILDEWRPELHKYIGGAVRKRKGELLAAGGIEDHMHLLVRLSPAIAVSDILRDIKAVSSGWRHKCGHGDFEWQGGYGAFTVSSSMVESVSDYIARQREHHRTLTFQEEYLELLRKHGVEYDEKYIWD